MLRNNRLLFVCFCLFLFATHPSVANALNICQKKLWLGNTENIAYVPYCSNFDLGEPNTTAKQLIIAIHSSSYDAKGYLDSILDAEQLIKHGALEVLIIAPQFLHVDKLKDVIYPKMLIWDIAPFRGTSRSRVLGTKSSVKLSAFEVLEDLISHFTNQKYYPSLKLITLLGHSAGGQMVNRFAASNLIDHHLEHSGIVLRYVVIAPSSYVYFSEVRPAQGMQYLVSKPSIDCPKYDNWPYGLNELYSYHRRHGIRKELIKKQYSQRYVIYLVGEKDNDNESRSIGRSCGAMLQGRNRLERAAKYANYLEYEFGKGIWNRQRFEIIKNIGHWGRGLILSSRGLEYIFGEHYKLFSQECVLNHKEAPYKVTICRNKNSGVLDKPNDDNTIDKQISR